MSENNVVPISTQSDAVLDNVIRCHRVELKSVDEMSVRTLFSGFDTLRAIGFSAEAGFVDRIVGMFSHVEIIIGASFIIRKNRTFQDALCQALAAIKMAGDVPEKHANIGSMLRSGSLDLKSTTACLDHRKLYILSAVDGRTRVIISSANMSGKAWSGDQLELYVYDDSVAMYDACLPLFDAAWAMSVDIPFEAAKVKGDDLIDGNVAIRGGIQLNNMVVVPAQPDVMTREITEYVIRHEDLTEEYSDMFKDLRQKDILKGGFFRLLPEHIEKARRARAESLANRQVNISISERGYPAMRFSYDGADSSMYIDDNKVDLTADEADIRADIENLLAIFGHFEDDGEFVGNLAGLRQNHYRFLIYMLMAPHVAKLRCVAYANGITETSLPLFIVLTSRQPNTGKTFMAEAVLRLMTGLSVSADKGDGTGVTSRMRDAQSYVRGTPYVFDEVSATSFGKSIKSLVKNADECERHARDRQPVIVFTSNEMVDPDDVIRKRAIHLLFDAALKSDVDQNGFRNQGNRIKKRFTGAFYREFSRRVLPFVSEMIEYMWSDDEKPDTWYPDVVALSSKVFLEMLSDYGYDAPAYMTTLSWNEDYYAVRKASENTISEIQAMYDSSPEVFDFGDSSVTIRLGTDSRKQKLMKSWTNTLPPEVRASCYSSMQTGSVITMDIQELVRLGFRYKKRFSRFGFFRRKR